MTGAVFIDFRKAFDTANHSLLLFVLYVKDLRSEGFYISEQLDGEDTLISLLRNPDIQQNQAGAYKCTGMNNITNWSSEKSGYIDLNYRCESFNFLFLIQHTDSQNYLL